ncbi:sodium channel subunit beta-2-like [Acipenser oxyrinchus oxyrinchus]|uniref:Sodium channel subunit beta-2-like n=1 Tax=Acipenser oxyrinchus oxyrinchus TaxID=40147 RepID=A0AAD8FN88_ACIOX|nr:sodium channel subunit beta-2-like [Acipenser oxyrinchus oxyrinchus]
MFLLNQMRTQAWMKLISTCFLGLSLILIVAPPASSMEVMVTHNINALNGSTVKLACNFNSCYRVDKSKFSMNWTYQECFNCTEELFLLYKHKDINLWHPRFGGRVVFTGNPDKNDVSVTISEVQLSDEGVYHCYVKNPPDRQLGHGVINFNVITEVPPERDSTIAVIIGASVGGLLAVLILAMVVVKCLRRRKKQELASQEQKLEEEGKNEGGEGGAEDSSK